MPNTLNQLVRHTRHSVNNKIFREVMDRIVKNCVQEGFISLLASNYGSSRTLFNQLKDLPQRPSIKKFSNFLKHYKWLLSFGNPWHLLSGIAQVKIEQFAAEAKSLSSDELKKMNEPKCYTYLASLICKSQSKSKDALTSMVCRLVSSAHKQSRAKLESKLQDNKADSCDVAELLKSIVEKSKSIQESYPYGEWVADKIKKSGGANVISEKCDDVIISHSNEHRVFLSQKLLRNRSLLHKIIKIIDPQSPTGDDKLVTAIQYIIKNYGATREYYDDDIDLPFISAFWRNRIFKKFDGKQKLNRKELESCIIDYLSKGLNSGDIYIKGSDNYTDYRSELMPWDECLRHLDEYCEKIGIPNNPREMVSQLKSLLIKKSNEVDENYHKIKGFKITDDGTPSLKKYEPKPKNENAEKLESIIKDKMPERTLLDVLSNVEHYVNWTAECGASGGQESKLDNPIEKYILTAFAIGTGLGFNQTSTHVRSVVSPRILSRVNAKHFSIKSLNKSVTKIINFLNQFALLDAWGSGERCAVDGTFEDINDNNLFSENHFRYRAKGGIAYHHVADNYIAIFSMFIQCGVWEAIYIIDGLLKNASEIQPKIIHADTQGQSLPVFAFAYLFGIDLMPRIRNWKDLKIYRPEKNSKYINIDPLFSDAYIDWNMLETYWKDFMQVVISVKFGKVSSAFILNKLNSYNNKNRLYKAFQELGKVQRTSFFLDFISDQNLRKTITDSTNKAEAYNGLSDWVRFGEKKLVATNDPDEMEKSIKYNQLITNSIMLQDVIDMTNIFNKLKAEGYKYTIEEVGYLSPYIRSHIKRFGEFVLDLNNKPANIDKIRDSEVF
ncbi:MAG: Tn3 family transposase [Gammaproteobacteria bacterium]|nr:Tn3 family transposase [Gammaproteobacteria bacterium]